MDYEDNMGTVMNNGEILNGHDIHGINDSLYGQDFSSFYSHPQDAGFESAWDAPSQSFNSSLPTHDPALYQTWQQPSSHLSSIEPVARQFISPSSAPQQPATYTNHQHVHQQFNTAATYDPALTAATFASSGHDGYQSDANLFQSATNAIPTIAPPLLDESTLPRTITPQRAIHSQPLIDQKQILATLPPSQVQGRFLILDRDALSKTTKSKQMAAFVNIGLEDFEYPINKAVIPASPVRRSRKELRKLALSDPKLLAKLGRHTERKLERKAIRLARTTPATKPRQISRPLVQLAGIKSEPDSSTEDSSEDDSSDDDSETEPVLPSPLPAKRPDDDAKAAVHFDTLKALWRPQRTGLPHADIKVGLKDYWEVVRTVRDRWKADTAAVKEAEDKAKLGELPLLKSRVRDQREMMESSFKAALEHGNRDILALSSENSPFLFLCYQFLLDRLSHDDHNGPLAKSILGVLVLCDTLTEEKLAKTHLVKLIPRYLKKGDTEVQDLVKRIESAAKEGTKKSVDEAQAPKKTTATAAPTNLKQLPSGPEPSGVVAGVKRPAPASSALPSKRIASTENASRDAATTAQQRPSTGVQRKTSTSAATKPGSAPAVAVTKVKAPAAKSSGLFNVMQSASKKPVAATKPAISLVGTSTTKAPAPERKPAVNATITTSAGSGFSFADTIAGLTKPKASVEIPKQKQESKLESEDQKKKRVRKESRRGLRVTWRPENALVQIKYFTHDPDEDLGHDANMMRDFADVGGEGRMFKQHKDMMDVDDEDDTVVEEQTRLYIQPNLIDFSSVDEEERERNFAPYGGGKQVVTSVEKGLREQHEASTLIVFYPASSDVPPNPKEPVEVKDVEQVETKSFGSPQSVTLERAEELKSRKQSVQPVSAAAAPSAPAPDLATLLASLAPKPAPQAPVAAQTAQSNLEQPEWQRILAQIGQSQANTAPSMPSLAGRPMAGMSMNDPFAGLPSGASFPPPPPQPHQAPPDLAAILASLQQGQTNSMPVPPPPGSFPAGFAGMPFPAPPGMVNPGQQQLQYPAQQQQFNTERGKNKFADKMFTQPCKYWSLGKCQKGSSCTYLHE